MKIKRYIPLLAILPSCVKGPVDKTPECYANTDKWDTKDRGLQCEVPILNIGEGGGCIFLDFSNSDLQRNEIMEIFAGVSSRFMQWNHQLIITTDSTLYFSKQSTKRIRCRLSKIRLFSGVPGEENTEIGKYGWAWLSSFENKREEDKGCYVNTVALGHTIKFIIETTCHEIGHTFGLQHHFLYNECKVIDRGNINEAPIMGSSNCAKEGVWNIDQCSGQNDTLIISNMLK
jgi:hypothetical protein